MSSKDALPRFRMRDLWGATSRRLAASAVGVLAVAAVFLTARSFPGNTSAQAQAPRVGTLPRGTATAPAQTRAAVPVQARPAVQAGSPTGRSNVAPAASLTPVPAVTAAPANARTAPATGVKQTPAAVVNGDPIMPDQLANECLRRFGKEVLESIVNKQLIWQECQKQSIKITEQDVEDEVDRMAQKFGLSTDRWLAMLKEERDIQPDQYRREIIWPTIALRRLAAKQTQVTEEELKQAFESEYGPQVKVRMIALLDAKKAEEVHRAAVQKPDTFPELAKQFSQDPNSAASRGVIPPIRRHVGDPEVERIAFSLKKGEVSPVIHVANQHLILRCEEHLQESFVSSQDLPRVEQRLSDQIRDNKLRTAAAGLFQKLQGEAKVVNVLNDPQRSQQMPGVAATINNTPISMKQLADECVQRHGKDVLEGEISRRLLEQELRRRNRQVTQAAVDEEIRRAADAYEFRKPDGSPDVEGWLKSVTETENLTVDLYVRDMVWPSVALKTIIGEKVEVTNEDLQKGFESNYGERVEVLAIVLSNQKQATKVWELARANPTDQGFGELSHQYSVEPISRANYGKVPPIRRYGGQPVVEEEAFSLKPGELSGIISIADKFIVLRCLGRTKPVVAEFATVKDELLKDLQEKKMRLAMAQEFDRLRESAQIDNFLKNTSQAGTRLANQTNSVAPATARQPVGTAAGVAPAGPPRATSAAPLRR